MNKVTFRNFQSDDALAMVELQRRCLEICADTGIFEPGFWCSPGFLEGKNIIIAADSNSRIIGYAAISSEYYSNTLDARVFWIDLRTDPDFDRGSKIKDSLLEKIIQRGREIKIEEKRERAAIGATYFAQGQTSIDYLKSHMFTNFESMFAMRRNLSDPIPKFRCTPEIQIKPWKMETRSEKQAYFQARELAFGYPLGRLDLLEHFTNSELWLGGTTFTAFANQEIVASVMALANGLLDYVFVIPAWRGKGIAKVLVAEAMEFLQDRDIPQAWLEVYSHNQAAINLYQSQGFETFKEEISLGYLLN